MVKQISTTTFSRFVMIGAASSGVQYLIMFVLIRETRMQAVTASGIGFVVSAIANFLMNSRLNFRSKGPYVSTVPRFFATASAGLGINSAVLFMLGSIGIQTAAAQILTTAVVMFWNYIVNALWTFKAPTSAL
jgi:putative flippase GtrA